MNNFTDSKKCYTGVTLSDKVKFDSSADQVTVTD